jgi:hypothetical protein
MRFSHLLAFTTFSAAVFAAQEARDPKDDLNGILAALQETSPDDATAAQSLNKRDPQNDLAGILAAL